MIGGGIDLSGLKDIIVPIKPDFFPPAIGWWIVMIGGIVGVLIVAGIAVHHYFLPLSYALRELKKTYQQEKKAVRFAKNVSKLLKRAAILKFGSEKVSALSDEMWARFLSQQAHGKIEIEIINFIAFSAYLPDNQKKEVSNKVIYNAAELLLKNILKDKKK